MSTSVASLPIEQLRSIFADHLQMDVPLARYTAARVGGNADALVVANSSQQLADAAHQLWELSIPFMILGGGSNVLISDAGVREFVLLNRAKTISFDTDTNPPTVWVESGANFGRVARQAAAHGLSGLSWAIGIPGTVGGAVFGNAGAHGEDVAGHLVMAEILQQNGQRVSWSADEMHFSYRSSRLKREKIHALILAARFRLSPGTTETVQSQMDGFNDYRKSTQPPGASMGSMFKNPPEDYAGRLIEAAGLKGACIGGAEISALHANFFINHGEATASDIYALLILAQETVAEKFDLLLEPEIEFIGDWER
jgi:UDP-N-acetylmuramate dehydrogenase